MKNCLFCQIVRGEEPADFVYQDDKVVALNDPYPQAKTHILVIPRKHLSSIGDMEEENESLVGHLFRVAKEVAQEKGLSDYHLIINTGEVQRILHLHLHLVSPDIKHLP